MGYERESGRWRGPGGTRKYRSVSVEKRGFFQIAAPPSVTPLSLSLSLFVEPAGKMLGEAGLEKCGTR